MTQFQIQKSSSTVNWTGKKVLGLHTGTINVAGGSIRTNSGLITGGEVNIDMNSIVITDIEDRESHQNFLAHLRNDDFFSVEKFNTAKLTITEAVLLENNRQQVNGLLTIKDISHPVSFTATVETFSDYLHSLGEIVIDRTLYNIRYGSGKFLQNLGDNLIYDDFVLQFKLIAQKLN
ncbi:MAG: YceI family protein [Bacteroidia bacterium]|nr:YceI family protein [Bacteroidia bacterium]